MSGRSDRSATPPSGSSGPDDGPRGEFRARDSMFGERIERVWLPKPVPPPISHRVAAALLGALSMVTTCFAIAVAAVLHLPIGSMLVLGGWFAVLAIAVYLGPGWWRREVKVVLTAKHVIWRRGRLRRSIDRRTISFARIHWHRSAQGVGDLELVRAVPTGALRRTLSITLPDLAAPDAVWAEIRGVPRTNVLGDGARPLGQRLDLREQVLWTARPEGSGWSTQRALTLGIALLATTAAVRALLGGVHALKSLLRAGLPAVSAPFGAVALAIGISVGAVLLLAGIAGYWAIFRPRRLAVQTRYVVTDRRVLIQRGSEELHLDREHIVDIIDAPIDDGRHDLFLVLQGPNARAHALAGAFGERVRVAPAGELLPVLRGVRDVETVAAILISEKAAA